MQPGELLGQSALGSRQEEDWGDAQKRETGHFLDMRL